MSHSSDSQPASDPRRRTCRSIWRKICGETNVLLSVLVSLFTQPGAYGLSTWLPWAVTVALVARWVVVLVTYDGQLRQATGPRGPLPAPCRCLCTKQPRSSTRLPHNGWANGEAGRRHGRIAAATDVAGIWRRGRAAHAPWFGHLRPACDCRCHGGRQPARGRSCPSRSNQRMALFVGRCRRRGVRVGRFTSRGDVSVAGPRRCRR